MVCARIDAHCCPADMRAELAQPWFIFELLAMLHGGEWWLQNTAIRALSETLKHGKLSSLDVSLLLISAR